MGSGKCSLGICFRNPCRHGTNASDILCIYPSGDRESLIDRMRRYWFMAIYCPLLPAVRPDLESASTSRPPGLPISKLIRKQMANERLERATKRNFLLLVLPCLESVLPVRSRPIRVPPLPHAALP